MAVWTAVVAAYPERYVETAVAAFERLGAVMVWFAPEEQIEAVVPESPAEM